MKTIRSFAQHLAVFAGLFASAAHAQWTPVGPAGSAQFFIDTNTLQRKEGMVQVWELVNMERADGEGVRSSRFLMEYDCKGQRSRGLDMLTYTEPMGGGKLLQQLGPDPDGWESVPPDSIFSQRMAAACGK